MDGVIELLKDYFTIFIGSMFKFVGGPAIGVKTGTSIVETTVVSALGMATTVYIITFFGDGLRRRIILRNQKKRNYRVFTPKKRWLIRVYKKFGITGIAFLTPVLFSPIVGGILAISFGTPPRKIILYMFISALFWGLILSIFFSEIRNIDFQHLFTSFNT